MSLLTLSDFPEFFAAAHNGAEPFPWQQRLVHRLVEAGRWPSQIVAPTGAGKTAVVDAHVFAVAAMAEGWGAKLPRRLTLVVPRRVLVDSQFEHACHIATLLTEVRDTQSVLGRVAAALRSLRWKAAPHTGPVPDSPLLVARIRGGLPTPRAWRDDPVACTVLSATPDMWGSRLLLQGYGSTRHARPREAGLVAVDAVAVLDEAHLTRQLLFSALAVANLTRQPKCRLGVPTLQVVETTATPSSAQDDAIGVEDDDLSSEILSKRLCTPKPLRRHRSFNWPASRSNLLDKLAEEIADEVIALRERFGPTVGVFVNTVSLAVTIAGILRKRRPFGDTDRLLTVELVCGRLRDYDLAELKRRHPGLLTLDGDPMVDILVATQSLEAGVDLDFSAALSELAPAQSLAQRAGRVNRLGHRNSTEIVVIVPDDPTRLKTGSGRIGPYKGADLQQAYEWLEQLAATPNGLAPQILADNPPPVSSTRRPLFQRVELADSWWWARTSDDTFSEIDLDLWLADDLDEAPAEAGIAVRRAMPCDTGDAVSLVRAIPPRQDEVFPAPLAQVRMLVQHLASRSDRAVVPATVVVRATEVFDVEVAKPLRPGDIVVIDETVQCFTEHTLDVTGLDETGDQSNANSEPDVSERRSPPRPGEVTLRVDGMVWGERGSQLLADYANVVSKSLAERITRTALADLLADCQDCSPMVGAAIELLRGRMKDADVIAFWDDETLRRLVVRDQRRATSDDSVRQIWTNSENPPTLEQHAQAVAARARELAETLKLDEDLAGALELAGLHHDDGKADLRFQRDRLGWDGQGELLAKGTQTSTRADRPSTLPAGWRHEQLSVAKTAAELEGSDELHLPLVLRLVGTSHGYGRSSFPHTAYECVPQGGPEYDRAFDLFNKGDWDDLVERTHRDYGVWGCAYLEAVLRAADGQVSGEGS